jgi:carbon-monoxide dehydrogenase medium subunit
MNFRLARPSVLVDLNRAAELAGIELRPDGALRVGAMTRQREVERSADVRAHAPLLAEAMPSIAHAQIRTRGTVGGSVAHADPLPNCRPSSLRSVHGFSFARQVASDGSTPTHS